MKALKGVSIFIGAIGVIWVVLGALSVADYIRVHTSGQTPEGRVVKVEEVQYKKSTSRRATIEYDDPTLGTRTFEQTLIAGLGHLKQGDTTLLEYAPGDPPIVQIAGTHVLWRELISFVAAALFFGAAYGVSRLARKGSVPRV